MQVIRAPKTYDVCIVGSGAGGGMAAKVLCEAGADVVMLEAGGMWDSARDSKMSAWPYDSPRRGAATPTKPFGEFDGCIGGWDIEGEPYTQAPGSQFDWFRGRMLGGRTNHWGRISLRMGPDDFTRRSLDGIGDDWPIAYDEIEPFYDKLDRLVGIFGSMEHLPNEPDGIFQPPPKPRCYELLIKQAADRLHITCIPNRLSILTQPLNGRPACHYCGQCGRGCATHANFSSTSVLLPPALATGKLRIVTNAMAREVVTDDSGRATGVSYVNRSDRRDYVVRARIVVLAASACESARLLLNSKSSLFPDGLANSSGVVGKYLTDTTGLSVTGHIPKLAHGVAHNEDGVGGMHLYMPWWLDNAKLDFPRGYHIELGGGRHAPSFGFMGGIQRFNGVGGYGATLKDDYEAMQQATVRMREGLAQFESGLAARRALAEGKRPHQVAQQWFRDEMNLQPPQGVEARGNLFGITPFHLFTMVLLIGFALAMVTMYYFKMRRAAALFGRIESDSGPPPPGSAQPLVGPEPPPAADITGTSA